VQVYSKCHVIAGKIASDIDNKKYAEAQAMLGSGTPIAVLSTSMAVAIMHLKRHTGTWD
jgi:stage V sporulation protein SpoVS